MDRLQRIRNEIRSTEDCASNQSLTPGTRRQCRDEAMDLKAMLEEAASLAAMHRKMAETSLNERPACIDVCRPCSND